MQYTTLNNWIKMPMLWFWVYKVAQNEAKDVVLNAINTWYRLIDTAQYYENERWVWQAIKASWIDRKEFFVTTKLITKWNENTLKWIDISLQKLWYDYFDLILIHRPKWDNISIYKAQKPETKSTVVGQGTMTTSAVNASCAKKKEGGVRYDRDLDLCCSINSGTIVIVGQWSSQNRHRCVGLDRTSCCRCWYYDNFVIVI